MKRLPIGIQSFEKLRERERGYVYVDKTKYAHMLMNRGDFYFLTRPRRFGKSLFVDTLRAIFEGRVELFEHCYIEDKIDFTPYPVIHLSFVGAVISSKEDMQDKIGTLLDENFARLKLKRKSEGLREGFKELILKAQKEYGKKVVILIDEYDKPLLDTANRSAIAHEVHVVLKDFFAVIKDMNSALHFLFITGVTRFLKITLFDGLNNIEDITLNSNYSAICGYTKEELRTYFSDYLTFIDLKKFHSWYSGYNFLNSNLFNPYDVLLFFSNNKQYKSYWFETIADGSLIKMLEQNEYFFPKFEAIEADETILNGSFDVSHIPIETKLFQSGYLSIKSSDECFETLNYELSYPNKSVKIALNSYILQHYAPNYKGKVHLYKALVHDDIEALQTIIVGLLQSLYTVIVTNRNHLFLSMFYSLFAALGLDIIIEEIEKDKMDMIIDLRVHKRIFIFELKLLEKEIAFVQRRKLKEPIKEIKEKHYHDRYKNLPSTVYLVGIEFNKKQRAITTFNFEEII